MTKKKWNHLKNSVWIALFAFLFACLGFVVDLNERDPSMIRNLLETLMMTAILFVIGCFLYGFLLLVMKWVR